MSSIFEQIKFKVTARQVAESYGIKVSRNGMACCPFHNDKHPSMKIDQNYYCFACGAKGDAINFVASMFEEIKKSLEKLSKQKPSSQPTAETLSEDIISLKKILKLIFDMQTKLYEAQQELPNALKQSITVKVQQPKYFWWLVLVGFLLSCSVSLNFYQWLA